MNKKEWLETFDSENENLLCLVRDYHPNSESRLTRRYIPITATTAEATCESIRQEIQRSPQFFPVTETLIKARQNEDIITITRILEETWMGLPESRSVWDLPGFFVLCDLCEGVDQYE